MNTWVLSNFIALILVVILLILNAFVGATDGLRLSDHISHYETLEYDKHELKKRHTRTRRSVYDKVLTFNITAFGRQLSLRLHPDVDTFHPDTIVEVDGEEIKLDTSHLFQGVVEGHPGSRVFGAVTDGVFQGRIMLSDVDKYHVERKEHYAPYNTDLAKNEKAHSVIYHDNSVEVEKFYRELRQKRSAEKASTCGNSDSETADWMDRVKSSASESTAGFTHTPGDNPYQQTKKDNFYSYVRQKRQVQQTTCNLFLQGDPELWKYYSNLFKNSATDEQIREEISALFHEHVQEVDGIYRRTTFRETGSRQSFTNHGFRVTRVLMNKTCECSPASCPRQSFCNPNIDASNLLNLNSYRNHNAYCLAYLFTYRDFDGGTLGLAWVAEAGKVGGVCSTYGLVRDGNVHGTRSLNTGIITLNNYRKRVIPRVSYLTFAHELGHNFGSKHDQEGRSPSCTPFTDTGSSGGNFIMFASATDGTKPNNDEFSSCSKNSIARVLDTVVNGRNGKKNCFTAAAGAWCGNQIKEDGEQCDCGYTNDCPPEDPSCCRCCEGQSDGNDKTSACKLKSGKRCDPSQGPCCNSICAFKSPVVMCRPEDDCLHNQTCAGDRAECPDSVHKADFTPCSSNTQVCKRGVCTGSLCELIKDPSTEKRWQPCEPKRDPKDPTSLCFLSCTFDNSTCYSSAAVDSEGFPAEFKKVIDDHNAGKRIPMSAGHICDMDKGFCDHFQKCRLINAQGPLARLKNLIFSQSTLDHIREWVTLYWYAVALSILGFIGLMILFVKCCAVHTPSSNPKKPPARRLSQTLTLRRRQHAQAAAARDPGQRRTQGTPQRASASNAPQFSNIQAASDKPPSYSAAIQQEPRNQRYSGPQAKGDSRQQFEMQRQPRRR